MRPRATNVIVAVLVALTATACESELRDSRLVVLNRSIGDVSLGMPRAAVERRYGQPKQRKVLRNYFPVGTRYEGKRLVRATYRIHAGDLTIEYVRDRVKTISTTSPYYRTAAGVGTRRRVPRDRCVRLDEAGHLGPRGCKKTWGPLVFEGECVNAWLTSIPAKAMTLLYMNLGRRIEAVQVGDPDVILPCF